MTETWTIGELTALVATTIGDEVSARNGRVRDVPDARTIRWYQTTGLVDRPTMRGRTALYGRRHLLQILAIKRLQAAGESLASIQAHLVGAPDATLEQLAGLASDPASPNGRADNPPRPRFWAATPTPSAAPTPDPVGSEHSAASAHALAGVPLDDGLTLLIAEPARPLTDADVNTLRAAAEPLLDALRRRGLAPNPSQNPTSPWAPAPSAPAKESR